MLKHSTKYAGVLLHNEPLKKYNTWRVGGAAEKLYKPVAREDLQKYLFDHQHENIVFIGLGSNILIRDGGIKGTIILLTGIFDELSINDDVIHAEAGLPCAKLARKLAKAGFLGAEFFAGIPGTVGGALAMNAGAWGSETWPHVKSVEVIDRSGNIQQVSADKVNYSYRTVAGLEGKWFLSANFTFDKGDTSLSEQKIKELLSERANKQPTGVNSCGSVFRNPENDYAARLIEACGLKGCRLGGASVSEKHANFIINDKQASAQDIENLIMQIQKTVNDKTGVLLQPEVRFIGEHA